MNTIVFSDDISLTCELLSGARIISDGFVSAIVIGTRDDVDRLSKFGANRILWLGEANARIIDDFIPTIQMLAETEGADLFLVGATVCGNAVAARTAAKLNTSVLTKAKEITECAAICGSHVIYGGGATRTERCIDGMFIATVTAGTYEPKLADKSCEIRSVAFIEPKHKIVKIRSSDKQTGVSGVTSAKRVVCAGKGFETKDDLRLAYGLAAALDAAVGYTRPVIEMSPPITNDEQYIGVSGLEIRPELYFAIATSGQVQHMAGVSDAKCIVGINSDADAPIFKNCDYGIVSDYREFVPELIEVLKKI